MDFSDRVLVVDNFYRNPLAVRDFALSLAFERESVPNYPGFQSVFPCLNEAVVQKIESLIKSKVDRKKSQSQMGYFRYINRHGNSRLHVHTDMVDWTGVIYLSPEPDPLAGTTFYRHKRSGLIGPPGSGQMSALGFKNFNHYENEIVEPDTLNAEAWDPILNVENRFNRCILFRSSELFHSHSRAFGQGLSDARLTQNFFIHTEDFNEF